MDHIPDFGSSSVHGPQYHIPSKEASQLGEASIPTLSTDNVAVSISSSSLDKSDDSDLSSVGKGLKTALKFSFNLIKNFTKYIIGYPLIGVGCVVGAALVTALASPFVAVWLAAFAASMLAGIALALAGKLVNIAVSIPLGVIGGVIMSPKIVFDLFFSEKVDVDKIQDSKAFKISQYLSTAAAFPFSALAVCFITFGIKTCPPEGGRIPTLKEAWDTSLEFLHSDQSTSAGALFAAGSIPVAAITILSLPFVGIGKLVEISANET
jgi:hypothetical protein